MPRALPPPSANPILGRVLAWGLSDCAATGAARTARIRASNTTRFNTVVITGFLLGAQRDDGVNAAGATRRQPHRDERDGGEDERDGDKDQRVPRLHAEEEAGHES